ncbi:MAG TPA: hypothetical protein VG733_06865 [Chthoniobacteraceae bacterium]|nr:hypothetical protein [Chthoniobacteraceae bacterium]
MKKLAVFVVILLFVYCAAYGVARWRKCIVMNRYEVKEQHLLVRHTAPGVDVRKDWKGDFKNKLNPVLYIIFRPLELIEDRLRGGSSRNSPLPVQHQS